MNLYRKIIEVFFKLGKQPLPPEVIYLVVNNVCNAHCLMCDVGLKNRASYFYHNLIQDGKNVLSIETLKKLIDEVNSFKPHMVICGTEPLLYKDLIPAIKTIKSRKLSLTLITNGILLEKFAKELTDSGIDNIIVSLDGLSEVHDNIRGSGVFDKVISGLNSLKQYKSESRKQTPGVILNCTVSNLNFSGISAFADEMVRADYAKEIRFNHLYFVTDEMSIRHNEKFSYLGASTPICTKAIAPEEIDIDALWSQITEIKEKYASSQVRFVPDIEDKTTLNTYYNNPDIPIGNDGCIMPWVCTMLQPNGDMIIRDRCFPYTVGNINETSFEKIWNGEKYNTFRNALKKHKFFPVCTRCCGMIDSAGRKIDF